MMNKKILPLVGSILFCEMAGIVGAVFTTSAISTWYSTINKPSFNPPSWVFGPTWTLLYALMGISLFLVWTHSNRDTQRRKALSIFFIQLFLNAIWSPIFFGLHAPLAAFIVIMLLWLSIVFTIVIFWKISRTAAMLLVPYLAWVSFASLLNFSIWQLNM